MELNCFLSAPQAGRGGLEPVSIDRGVPSCCSAAAIRMRLLKVGRWNAVVAPGGGALQPASADWAKPRG